MDAASACSSESSQVPVLGGHSRGDKGIPRDWEWKSQKGNVAKHRREDEPASGREQGNQTVDEIVPTRWRNYSTN